MPIKNNEMFVRACNQVNAGRVDEISLCYEQPHGLPPRITVRTNNITAMPCSNTDICDEEMDIAGWRRYGRSIKTSSRVKFLRCFLRAEEIIPEAAQCLQAFFKKLKENTSINKLILDIALITAISISAHDLRYFFQNKRLVYLGSEHQITSVQSAHLATALRDVYLNGLTIYNGSPGTLSSDEALIISVCHKVEKLNLFRLNENDHITAVAELLRDPTSLIQEIKLRMLKRGEFDRFDVERAEGELLASLTRNSKLKVMVVQNLFVEDIERVCLKIKNLLCDTTSLTSVCQSNHTLETIVIENDTKLQAVEEYFALNKIPNKRKVIRCKLMKYYFSRHVDLSSPDQSTNPIRPIANMPLGLLTELIGFDASDKQSAVFNILKCIPELCDVSGRNVVPTEGSFDADGVSGRKRQKVNM